MSFEKLRKHRRIWHEKGLLRRVYHRWYSDILGYVQERGPVLEIGGGGGNLKEFCPKLITSDYVFCPWLDVNLDAHRLPFRPASLGAVVAIDVLHHLQNPVFFIQETRRVLMPGGRLVLLEPFISAWSWPVYRFLHPEEVDFSMDLFGMHGKEHDACDKDPFDGNMAVATKLFCREKQMMAKLFPDFPVTEIRHSDFFLYPMSGGFEKPALCPEFLVPAVDMAERVLQPLSRFLAYRMLAVMEKEHEF
jgi:SAM-dependent methyltransferase